jgi:Fe-S cluster assembly protein SufD
VIERFETEGLAPSGQAQKETDAILPHMHNHMLQGILAKGAALEHYRLATLPDEFSHLYTAKVTLNERSDYRVFSDYKGGALARQEVDVVIAGQHARCDQQGLICAKGNEHHDMYLPVRHAAENSYSNQHIRQLLDDQSTGIFYGRVDVPRGSHNTEAHQLNRNMLVGEKSQAISRPELEILTDEVVCSHGSTTGSLNDEALYYLCARGLDMVQAKRLLVDAFIDEMLETVSLESVRNYRAAD